MDNLSHKIILNVRMSSLHLEGTFQIVLNFSITAGPEQNFVIMLQSGIMTFKLKNIAPASDSEDGSFE